MEFYHLAITSNFVLASSRSETIREFLATRSSANAATPPACLPRSRPPARDSPPRSPDSLS